MTWTPSSTAEEAGYAGFWRRFAAILIDGVVLFVPLLIVRDLLGPAAFLITLVGEWIYFALLESSSWQATLGKRALGVIVMRPNGERLTFWRATGRYFAKILSLLTLCIGYMLAGWNHRKRALHDMVADTVCVKGRTSGEAVSPAPAMR